MSTTACRLPAIPIRRRIATAPRAIRTGSSPAIARTPRGALVAGGLREEKLLQVRGLADVLPLDRNVADEPTNRRISILVMNNAAEQAFFRDGGRTTVDESAGARAAVLPAALTRPH